MSAFDGKSFIRALQHLEARKRSTYERHGKFPDGRWQLVESILEDVQESLIFDEDPFDA